MSFSYPGTERLILKDLSCKINPNESIAIVGENGAGKTTVVKLLSRLYDPTEGEILLDGVNIKKLDLKSYQRDIGIVFQDFAQYYLSARENIGVGLITEVNNTGKVQSAALRSGADEAIRKLPKGYDSILGKMLTEGNQLSIGEWQKIAIARAFMRDAKILILDEPTAFLDARSEYEICCRLKELTRDRISVLVSHRFSTVKMVDRILFLNKAKSLRREAMMNSSD